MTTIKSFTSIEQSKKLVEILPLETADMCYPKDAFEYQYTKEPVCHYNGIGLAHPCWSLAALLDVLPKIYGLKPILDLEECSIQYNGIDLYITASNPIDACYEMILKLNELKML